MDPRQSQSCTAFAGTTRIASGAPADVAAGCKAFADSDDERAVLVFDDVTAQPVEFDLRGSLDDVLRRLSDERSSTPSEAPGDDPAPTDRAAGRPRLGVVGREVTLLPRHWEWLNAQPGSASVTLRKLVDQARRANASADRVRRAQEAAFRFMSAIAGNERGFEEASRALFAGDRSRFGEQTVSWPADVKDFARALAEDAFAESETSIRS